MSKDSQKPGLLYYIDSIVILTFSLVIWFLIPVMIEVPLGGNKFTSPSLFPKLIAAALFILSIIQLIIQIAKRKLVIHHEVDNGKGELKTFSIGLSLVVIYVLLIPILGFLTSTLLGVFSFVYFFGKPKWYNALIFTVVTSFVIYGIFDKFLNVPLPTSIIL